MYSKLAASTKIRSRGENILSGLIFELRSYKAKAKKRIFSKKNKKLNFLRNPEYLNNCLLFFWATKYQLQGRLQNKNATAFPATTLQFDFTTMQPAGVKTKHEISGICIQCVEAISEVWYQLVWIFAGILTFRYIFEIYLDIKSKVCSTKQIFMHIPLFSKIFCLNRLKFL